MRCNNIDKVIALIKASDNYDQALDKLHENFALSFEQGKAILEMRLQRLTALSKIKFVQKLTDIKQEIARLQAIIENAESLKQEIIKELNELKGTYADKRRTRIEGAVDVLSEADLIPDEDVVVTLTRKGYIKRVPVTLYNVQHRGGKGKMGMADLDDSDDIVEDIFAAKNHDDVIIFHQLG